MAKKEQKNPKTKQIIVKLEHARDVFSTLWPFGQHEETLEFQGIQDIRHLLSNAKAKVLVTIKTKQPRSIYALAKILRRDFKSVRQDVKLLEKFGLVRLERQGKTRKMLKPSLALDELNIILKI